MPPDYAAASLKKGYAQGQENAVYAYTQIVNISLLAIIIFLCAFQFNEFLVKFWQGW